LTEPSSTEDPAGPVPPAPDPGADATPDQPATVRGLTSFTIEGRRAPGLFVAGWLATLIGVGLLLITVLGIGGAAGALFSIAGLVIATAGFFLLGGAQTVERRAAGLAYAGPSPILVFVTVLAVSRLAGFAVGVPLAAIGADIPRPLGDLVAAGLQAVVFVGLVRLMVVGAGALSWRDMGLVRNARIAAQGILGGAVFAAPVILVTSVVAIVAVQLAGGATPPSPLPPTGTASGLVLHLIAGAVIAPFAEEVLFRGFALTAWRRSVGPRRAILWTSIVFVLAHLLLISGDTFGQAASLAFVAALVRVPVALALGWLFVRTGTLWAPIGLHAAYNAILILIGESVAGG